MAAVSNVTIANLALSQLGDMRILSLNDDTKPAREVRAIFDTTRDAELRKHRWNFAIVTTELAALNETAPAPYTHTFMAARISEGAVRVNRAGRKRAGLA